MFFNKITKDRLKELLPEIYEGVDFHQWHEKFPSIVGYEPHLPHSFEDIEQYPDSFRSDDQVIAYEMVKYPEFHEQMVDTVRFVMEYNSAPDLGMWYSYDDEEYPGLSYASALSLHDAKYISLFSEFLLTIEPRFTVLYLAYDIIKVVKKWGWTTDSYHLLLVYWFSSDKAKRDALDYLLKTGFAIRLSENDATQNEDFVQALKLFSQALNRSDEGSQANYIKLFDDLFDGYIFTTKSEKTEKLKDDFHAILENKVSKEPTVKRLL